MICRENGTFKIRWDFIDSPKLARYWQPILGYIGRQYRYVLAECWDNKSGAIPIIDIASILEFNITLVSCTCTISVYRHLRHPTQNNFQVSNAALKLNLYSWRCGSRFENEIFLRSEIESAVQCGLPMAKISTK